MSDETEELEFKEEEPVTITMDEASYNKLVNAGHLEKAIIQMAYNYRYASEERGDGVVEVDQEFALFVIRDSQEEPEEVWRCRPLLFPLSLFKE